MKLFGRISLYFDRIATQLSALLVIASVVTFAITGFFFVVLAPDRSGPMPSPDGAIRIATLLQALDAVSAAARRELIAAYSQGALTVKLDDASAPGSVDPASRALLSRIVRDLPPGIRIVAVRSDQPSSAAVRALLRDGQAVTINVLLDDDPFPPPPPHPEPPEPSFLSPPVLLPLIFIVASTILLSIWAARRLAAPLARFAAAVDRFSGAGIESPVREEGPSEIRRAARAFNRMRRRIIRLIEDRTTTLIAISHDLRTPLTRLRLRTEEIPASAEKIRMLEDLELMDSMIASAVTYLREGSGLEALEMADLPSVIETICDQFADTGHTVVYEGPQRFAMLCRPQSLGRAISNLIENATKFGTTVTARLTISTGSVAIDVEDDGPGIPDEEKQRVMEPFYRTDPARQATGGFGLGLAIVLAVAESHGGTLTLLDRQPRGLCARMSFPSATSADLRAK